MLVISEKNGNWENLKMGIIKYVFWILDLWDNVDNDILRKSLIFPIGLITIIWIALNLPILFIWLIIEMIKDT